MAHNTKRMLTDSSGHYLPLQSYNPTDDIYEPFVVPRIRDSFSGNANVTKTYTSPMRGFAIQNDGTTDIVFTINMLSFTVKPSEGFEDTFQDFTTIDIVTTSAFRAVVKG